jgi:hypothetical protein
MIETVVEEPLSVAAQPQSDVAEAIAEGPIEAAPTEVPGPERPQFGPAAERIAEALTGMVSSASKDLQTRTDLLLDQVQGCTRHLATLDARVRELITRMDIMDAGSRYQTQAADHLTELCGRLEKAVQVLSERQAAQDRTNQALRNEVRQGGGLLDRLVGTLRGIDLRKEERVITEEAVKVFIPGDPEVVIAGTVVNASQTGLGLILELPVPVGSEIRLDVDGALLSGKVSYCRSEAGRYSAGLNSVRHLNPPAAKDADSAKSEQPPAAATAA